MTKIVLEGKARALTLCLFICRLSDEHTSAVDRLVRTSGKMVLLDKLMRRLRETGHRVLIFSQVGLAGACSEVWLGCLVLVNKVPVSGFRLPFHQVPAHECWKKCYYDWLHLMLFSELCACWVALPCLQMVRVLDVISDYLRLRGYPHQRLDGSTPAAARHAGMRQRR
jgi:hypothetical protein